MTFLYVGIGGFLGAIARYGVARALVALFPGAFPTATLVVNVTGSFAIGFLYEGLRDHRWLPTATLLVGVGFLGAYTTFSTFSFETLALWKRGEAPLASVNVAVNVGLCLAAVVLGEWVARSLR